MLDKLFAKASMMMCTDFILCLEFKEVVAIASLCKSIRTAIFEKNQKKTLVNWLNAYHRNDVSESVNQQVIREGHLSFRTMLEAYAKVMFIKMTSEPPEIFSKLLESHKVYGGNLFHPSTPGIKFHNDTLDQITNMQIDFKRGGGFYQFEIPECLQGGYAEAKLRRD